MLDYSHLCRHAHIVPWEAVIEDYKDACKLYHDAPVPEYDPGQAPAAVILQHYGFHILSAAAKASAQRLAIVLRRMADTAGTSG